MICTFSANLRLTPAVAPVFTPSPNPHPHPKVGELMDDFSCAVESTVLLHGRLYVTDRFVCFYSNLFGLEKKVLAVFQLVRLDKFFPIAADAPAVLARLGC